MSQPDDRAAWSALPNSARKEVIDFLRREADRRHDEADRLTQAARTLGRPSLIEDSALGAEAFLLAISLLARSVDD